MSVKFDRRKLLVASVIVLSVWLGHQRRCWYGKEKQYLTQLLDGKESPSLPKSPLGRWEELPPVVRDYFRRVLSVPEVKSPIPSHGKNYRTLTLRAQQVGRFKTSDEAGWQPFTAKQTTRGPPNPGFLWQAEMKVIPYVSVSVRDAWINGQAFLEAALAGVVPLVSEPSNPTNRQPLIVGEMLRWLAEAFLIPTVLLPENGLVEWHVEKDTPENMAQLRMMDPYQSSTSVPYRPLKLEVNVTFCNEDTIRVDTTRPKGDTNGNIFQYTPWTGFLSNFTRVAVVGKDSFTSFYLPSHMKAGWKESDQNVSYYFEADNQYQLFEEGQPSESDVVLES